MKKLFFLLIAILIIAACSPKQTCLFGYPRSSAIVKLDYRSIENICEYFYFEVPGAYYVELGSISNKSEACKVKIGKVTFTVYDWVGGEQGEYLCRWLKSRTTKLF